jgi:hypothetical protein
VLNRRSFVVAASLGVIVHRRLVAQPLGPARYTGELLLRPLDDGRMMEVQQPFGYVDANRQPWNVPAKAVVDGASIPRVFWSVVGGPWDGRYREASVIHDWFCAVRTRPWQQVHRVFYEAMLTSRVEPRLARLMFLAVRYAGPSWDELTIRNARILSRDGTVRLDPPGIRPVVNGFASQAEEAEAKAALRERFEALVEEAEAKDLSAAGMEQLVDRVGREEDVAAMIGP